MSVVQWQPAVSPRRPQGKTQLVTLSEAYLTPFERGDLRVLSGPRQWMRGAVYDSDGQLVQAGQRINVGHDVSAPIAADPDLVRIRPHAPRLEGTWLYGGNWMTHFGHFLVETLSSLWPESDSVDGLLFHRSFRGAWTPGRGGKVYEPAVTPWQQRLLDLAGYGDLPVRVKDGGALVVEKVIVPSRSVVFKNWAFPEAVTLWERIGQASGESGTDARVFLSRSRFNPGAKATRIRSSQAWDQQLDDAFTAAGFVVVHPELLPIDQQIRLVRGAEVIAGASGSALHLSAFAPRTTRVIEVGDERSPGSPFPTQQMIDAAVGRESAFIPYGGHERVRQGLAELGLG